MTTNQFKHCSKHLPNLINTSIHNPRALFSRTDSVVDPSTDYGSKPPGQESERLLYVAMSPGDIRHSDSPANCNLKTRT